MHDRVFVCVCVYVCTCEYIYISMVRGDTDTNHLQVTLQNESFDRSLLKNS